MALLIRVTRLNGVISTPPVLELSKRENTPAPKTMTAEFLPDHKASEACHPEKEATASAEVQTVGLHCQCTSFNKRKDRYLHTQGTEWLKSSHIDSCLTLMLHTQYKYAKHRLGARNMHCGHVEDHI